MYPYKIVESPEGIFKVYHKGWIFWHALKYVIDGEETTLDEKCYTLHEAEKLLERYCAKKEQLKAKPKFKKKTRVYGENGKRPDRGLLF